MYTIVSGGLLPATGTAQIPYRIVELPNGDYLGVATVTTPAGPVAIKLTASPNAEARRMLARLQQNGATSGFLGKLFKGAGSLIKSVGKVAKKVAQGKLLGALKESAKVITQNPLARKALAAVTVPWLGPGAKFVPAALRGAGKLLFSARARKSPKARRRIAQVLQRARRGDMRAQKMARYIAAANRISRRRGWNVFRSRQPRQPRRYYQPPARYQRPRYNPRALRGYRQFYAAGEQAPEENGQWVATAEGQVFVPHAYEGAASGLLELSDYIVQTDQPRARTLREYWRLGLSSNPR